eukprot:gene5162-5814_t
MEAKNKEIDELTEELLKVKSEINEKEKKIVELVKYEEDMKLEANDLAAGKEVAEQAFRAQTVELDQIKTELSAEKERIVAMEQYNQSKISESENNFQAERTQSSNLKIKLEDLESILERERREMAEFNNQISSDLATKEDYVKQLETKQEAIKEKNIELEVELTAFQKKIESKDSEILDYKGKIEAMSLDFEEEKGMLAGKCEQLEKRLRDAEKCIDNRDLEIGECRNEIKYVKGAFEKEKQELEARLKEELEVAVVERSNAESNGKEIEIRLGSTNEENTALRLQLEEEKTALQNRNSEKTELLKQQEMLRQQLAKLDEDFKVIEAEKESRVEEVKSIKEEKDLLEQDLLSKHNNEINKLISEKENILEECTMLQGMLKESQKQNGILKEKGDVMNRSVESKRKELEVYKTQVDDLRSQQDAKDSKIEDVLCALKEAENELTEQKEQHKRSVLFHERELSTFKANSEQVIRELENELADLTQERNAEKLEYHSMLTDMSEAKKRLEAKYEVNKGKETAIGREGSDKINRGIRRRKINKQTPRFASAHQRGGTCQEHQSLDEVKGKLDKHSVEVERRAARRHTILFGDASMDHTLRNNTMLGNTSLDEQSTLVADELTMRRSPSLTSLQTNDDDASFIAGSMTSLNSNDVNFSFRSSRRQSGIVRAPNAARRQSLLYIAGKTPPDRRTTIGAPVPQMMVCENENEPDILEYDSFDRVSELQRRNTLCLPHLKSSYPLELITTSSSLADKQKTATDNLQRGDNSRPERKRFADDVVNGRPLKRKDTDAASRPSSKDRGSTRYVKSDSNIVTRSMLDQGSKMIWGDSSMIKDDSMLDTQNDPRRESVAFVVSFGDDDEKKKLKPNASMRRARGSAHLVGAASTTESKEPQKHVVKKTATAGTSSTTPTPVKKSSATPNNQKKWASSKENIADNKQQKKANAAKETPLKRTVSDKNSLKTRTNNIRSRLDDQ